MEVSRSSDDAEANPGTGINMIGRRPIVFPIVSADEPVPGLVNPEPANPGTGGAGRGMYRRKPLSYRQVRARRNLEFAGVMI